MADNLSISCRRRRPILFFSLMSPCKASTTLAACDLNGVPFAADFNRRPSFSVSLKSVLASKSSQNFRNRSLWVSI